MSKGIKKNPISNFTRGFLHPFRAAKFLKNHPPLLKYAIIPFILNVVLLSAAVYLGLRFFDSIVVNYIPQGEAWYWAILTYFLWTAAVLVTMVLVFFCFTVTGSLVGSPFNDLLSERTEELLTGIPNEEPFIFKVFLKDAARTMMAESKKIIIFIVLMIMLLFLNLLPGGTLLYSFLSILLTVFFLAIEYTGYIFFRKHLTFTDQRRFIFSHKFLMLGFGIGVMAVLTIPFFQFFCIPLGVVGATRLYHDYQSHEAQSRNDY